MAIRLKTGYVPVFSSPLAPQRMPEQICNKFAGFRFEFSLPDPLKLSDASRQALLRVFRSDGVSMPAITIPTKVESTTTTFTPAFPFIAQTNDFDDVFACAAMLAGKTIEEVREIAIAKTKHPARGPYYLGETQIAALLAQLGLVATVYKELSRVADLPDVALILVDFNSDMEVGRHILFHRAEASHSSGTTIEYALDPALWCKAADRVRTNFKNIAGHWAIGIHAMSTKAGAGK